MLLGWGTKKTQGVMEMIYEYLDADTGQTVHLSAEHFTWCKCYKH